MKSDAPAINATETPANPEDASETWTWAYMQTVLDDALNAVHDARVRNEEISLTIDDYRRAASELEERCAFLESQCKDVQYEADSTEDTLTQLRQEHEALEERYAQALLGAMNLEATVKQARNLETRLRAIADAVVALDEKTTEIHNHYGNDLDAHPHLVEEINFARDETLEVVRRAVAGLRSRSRA